MERGTDDNGLQRDELHQLYGSADHFLLTKYLKLMRLLESLAQKRELHIVANRCHTIEHKGAYRQAIKHVDTQFSPPKVANMPPKMHRV
jgi:hypothetical protein